MIAGENQVITATFERKSEKITVTSSNPEIIIVNELTIKALKEGIATIKVVSKNGYEVIKQVKVTAPKFTVNYNSIMEEGKTQTCQYLFEDVNKQEKIDLVSNNPDIVLINNDGSIKALKTGVANLVATSVSGHVETFSITVNKRNVSFTIVGSGSMEVDTLQTLTLIFDDPSNKEEVNITSEDETIILINNDGSIKALNEGKTKITATSVSGYVQEIEIEVLPKSPLTFTILGYDSMDVGSSQSLSFVFNKTGQKETVTLKSSDTTIINVIKGSLIRALKDGIATITATSASGHVETIEITVIKVVKTFTISYNLSSSEENYLPNDAPISFKDNELPFQLPMLINTDDGNYSFLGWKINDTIVKPDEDPENLFFELGTTINYNVILTPVWGLSRLRLTFPSTPTIGVNDTFQIGLELFKIPNNIDQTKVKWESNNPLIATITQTGLVTAIVEGTVDITAYLEEKPTINMTVGITIDNDVLAMNELMAYFYNSSITEIIAKRIGVTGYQFNYNYLLLSSVSNYLFEDYDVVEAIIPETNSNRPQTVKDKYYVTVHDTASSAKTADGASHAKYVFDGGGGTSWHYSVGNDGIYHQIPDNEVAYHAGDGTSVSYYLIPTGIKATTKYPMITISIDGYYELNGEKTTIIAPRYIRYQKDSEGNYIYKDGNKQEIVNRLCVTADINDAGIEVVIKDGEYYMGPTYFNDTYAKIANRGGNNNSIGIETCVNEGSDLYYTWQKTAKLVAHLCYDNNIPLDHVKPHHYFSGKNCPQTMRENSLWDNFLKLVEMEYEILSKYSTYKITFTSLDPTYLDNLGRVIAQAEYSMTVRYQITIEKDEISQTMEFSTIIPGRNTLK